MPAPNGPPGLGSSSHLLLFFLPLRSSFIFPIRGRRIVSFIENEKERNNPIFSLVATKRRRRELKDFCLVFGCLELLEKRERNIIFISILSTVLAD